MKSGKNFKVEIDKKGYFLTEFCLDAAVIDKAKEYLSLCDGEDNSAFYTSIWSEDEQKRAKDFEFIQQNIWPQISNEFSGYKLIMANFMLKSPGAGSSLGLHQDWTFTEEDQFQSFNIWIPLIDTTSENGPLCLVPGSHRIKNPIRGKNIDQVFPGETKWLKKYFGKTFLMKAGNPIVFSTQLLHYSEDNRTTKLRAAISMVIVPENSALVHYYLNPEKEEQINKIEIDETYFIKYSLRDLPFDIKVREIFRTEKQKLFKRIESFFIILSQQLFYK